MTEFCDWADSIPLMAGTVLVREHQEREHRVMVLPDGQFERVALHRLRANDVVRVLPGDPAVIIMGTQGSAEAAARIREALAVPLPPVAVPRDYRGPRPTTTGDLERFAERVGALSMRVTG